MEKPHNHRLIYFVIAFLFLFGLSACRPGNGDITPTPSEAGSEGQTETPLVTESPTPTTAIPAVIFTWSPEADPDLVAMTQTVVETLAAGSGLQVLVYDNLTPELIHSGVRIVVGVRVDLTGLAAGNPAVQFVAVDSPTVVPGANLSVIGDPVLDKQRQAFMGGYLAALVSEDYKVAGLLASDQATTTEEVNAFVIGARFFCGLCNPKYPPYNRFPQWETLPKGSTAGAYQTVADGFINLGVEVVYIGDGVSSTELTGYFAGVGLKVVSANGPDQPHEKWVGTVILDPAPSLAGLWTDLVAGKGGQALPMSVALVDTEAGLVSEGRMRLFDEMLVELEAGKALPEFTP